MPSYAQNHDYRRNIYWLQFALKMDFAPPIQALTICNTPEKYAKYQHLLKMHLNYLMAKNSVYLAARFDKHEPVWFNKPYRTDILKSLEFARYYYESAINYWQEVLKYKEEAEVYQAARIELDFLEDMVHKINTDQVNYQRVAQRQLKKLAETRNYFSEEG